MPMQSDCILGAAILAAMSAVTTLHGHHRVIRCRAFARCQLQNARQGSFADPLMLWQRQLGTAVSDLRTAGIILVACDIYYSFGA